MRIQITAALLALAAAIAVLADQSLPLPTSHTLSTLATLTDQPWDRLVGPSWRYLRRSSSKDAGIIVDATAPFSPPNVLRIVFPPDLQRDHQPTVHWTGLPGVGEIYVTWWIKLSPNWTPSPAGGGKMSFLWPPAGNGVTYSNIGGSAVPHRINIVTTWPAYGYKFWEPNATKTDVHYDQWYRIEWYVKWESSPGAGNGVIRWWVNGVLNGDYTTVQFPACCLQQFEFAPTLQNPPPAEQYMYVDHTYISITPQ
jgi:hypothetical protein